MSGASTTINVLYPEKMIDPLKPLLILPEVIDGSKWKRGQPYFADEQQQYVLMLFSRVDGFHFINTDYVKPEEMRAAKDLLNPKWKGKIATEDPSSSGSGSNLSVSYYSQLGPPDLPRRRHRTAAEGRVQTARNIRAVGLSEPRGLGPFPAYLG